VGNRHQEFLRLIEMPVARKSVASWMAYHACNGCGFTFVGVPTLSLDACTADSTTRACISELKRDGLVVVVGQGGGRGKATEYVVCPEVPKLSTGNCPFCGRNRNHISPADETLQQPEGIATPGRKTLYHPEGNRGQELQTHRKPSSRPIGNPPVSGAQPESESEPEPPRARERTREAESATPTEAWFGDLLNTLEAGADRVPTGLRASLDELAAKIGTRAVQRLREARLRVTVKKSLDSPSSTIPGSHSTAPDREEAQEPTRDETAG
jgi:hypothetical protein